ncbi:MAG TPA: tetratricopeptide repeat protein, partial [Balneolaceae bacterium]|nr:tetratricopeptide repeat protein [Balneolaceae bacterium]
MHPFFLLLTTLLLANCANSSQPARYVDDVEQARSMLAKQRTQVLEELQQEVTHQGLERLVDLGLWEKAQSYLDDAGALNSEMKLVQAELWMKRHRYAQAEKLVNSVLAANPEHRKARLLRADLFIQSWNLAKADSVAKVLLNEDNQDAEARWIRGRVALLKRDYDRALEWAQKVQAWAPDNAAGFLLEAQSQFWAQNPEAAEPALVRALEIDPFNADARFSYGYAIWRRVDATQLDEMAAQWNFALEINPLHYLTHWHFGNGHTNLTYADYAEPSDSLVQSRLDKADQLVAQEKLDEAIALTRKVERDFPQSVIPAMVRGSIYYMYYSMDRSTRLDSAGTIFRTILQRKQNYGPAHNGLAAVIKQRQFSYLDGFEKLEQAIKNTKMPEKDVFYEVFPDLNYYPGERVMKMVTQQLGPSRAYLPMINALGRDFQLPPLHHNLAEAMGNNYFLYGTTFDNRQWMDIRGVGSGATGIEYIERGSHWERNVLAHEYTHLYHGRILTDKESRRIRALYNAAMKNNRTLDYYSANNESEFFAQAYAAFLSEKKVYPLTHKSMNTRDYLRRKDPALYAFVDSLVQKQKAYLSGDEEVFNSNWAQTYLTLAQNRENTPTETRQYLDKALSYDKQYIPALLAYTRVEARAGNFDEARGWITKAQKLNS